MKSATISSAYAVQVFEPDPDAVYTIEAASHITRIPRHTIAVYCRHGLVTPVVDPERGGWFFDDSAIRTLRRIECLRREHGANLSAIGLIFDLLRRVEKLQQELRFLRV